MPPRRDGVRTECDWCGAMHPLAQSHVVEIHDDQSWICTPCFNLFCEQPSDHPVDVLKEVMTSRGLKMDPELERQARAYCDELVPEPES